MLLARQSSPAAPSAEATRRRSAGVPWLPGSGVAGVNASMMTGADGALAVGLDIVFADPTTEAEDAALAFGHEGGT